MDESSWNAVEETLSGSLLWTSLYCGEQSPTNDSECFGFEQPIVRRAAWGLLLSILEERKGWTVIALFAVVTLTDCRRRTRRIPFDLERFRLEIRLGGIRCSGSYQYVATFVKIRHRYVVPTFATSRVHRPP